MITTMKGFNRNKVVKLKQLYADPLIKLKKYTATYTSIGASLDKNGRPVTGLTEDSFSLSSKNVKIHITGTRKFMEKELGLPEDSLKQSSPFWSSYFVKVGSIEVELDLQDPHDLLKYLFVIAQSFVCNGLSEVEESAIAEYVVYSTEEENAIKVEGRRSLKDAYVLADKLDMETKVNILAVYGFNVDSSNINTINNKIDEKLEENPSKFLKIVNDDYLIFKSLIGKCLDAAILTMENGAIFHGEVKVGYDKDMAAHAIAKDKTLATILEAKLSGNMELIKQALIDAE